MGAILKAGRLADTSVRLPSDTPARQAASPEPPSRRAVPAVGDAILARPSSDDASSTAEAIGLGSLTQAAIEAVGKIADAAPSVPDLAELDRQRRAAREEGYREGLQRGRDEASKESKRQIVSVGEILAALRIERQRQLDAVQELAVELAFVAMGRILGDALATREGVIEMVRHALQEEADRHRLKIVRISPDDWNFLGEAGRAALVEEAGAGIQVVADARVKLGGCLLDLERGALDARLEVQLARLKDALLDARAANEQ